MEWKTIVCLAIFLILCIGITVILIPLFKSSPDYSKAAIIDNLAINYPNATFVSEARHILEQVGLKVEYFKWKEVTLDLYRKITQYTVVILRVHSGTLNEDVCFFTSESLANIDKYSAWSEAGYLVNASISGLGNFIGIKPSFIRYCLDGDFHNSTIIAMGCNSSAVDTMADAFIKKGARVYIGWNRDVTVDCTDNMTLELLKRFFVENKTVKEALTGLTDPKTYAQLKCYPRDDKTANLRPLMLIKELLKMNVLQVFPQNVLYLLLDVGVWKSYQYRRIFQKF